MTCYQKAIPLDIVPGTGLFIGDQFILDKSDTYLKKMRQIHMLKPLQSVVF
ncbi:hypothetical protein [Nostoc sp. 2RC]|uniref:hypothetical protein n=1 Tax=Nostoc sp. 2RC TaxID=2485484 RepID=UPI0016231C6B|nr:hypothetical protein [Nostoc sp. 2RC]MBC1236719.1 hypothetical protein [Nostoc sp. 2RC]